MIRFIARRLLEAVKVDRIEVASARVSEGELRAVKAIVDYAESKGMTDRVEILGFVDVNKSIDWAESVGVRVINLCRTARHDPRTDRCRNPISLGPDNRQGR